MVNLKHESGNRNIVVLLEDENVVIIKPKGVIVLSEIIECFNHLKSHKSFNNNLNYFIDIRSVKYTGNIELVKRFVIYINQQFSKSLNNRVSFLTESMEQIALASMFKMLQNKNLENLRFFTEMEDALIWTRVKKTEEEIEKIMFENTNFCSNKT